MDAGTGEGDGGLESGEDLGPCGGDAEPLRGQLTDPGGLVARETVASGGVGGRELEFEGTFHEGHGPRFASDQHVEGGVAGGGSERRPIPEDGAGNVVGSGGGEGVDGGALELAGLGGCEPCGEERDGVGV